MMKQDFLSKGQFANQCVQGIGKKYFTQDLNQSDFNIIMIIIENVINHPKELFSSQVKMTCVTAVGIRDTL